MKNMSGDYSTVVVLPAGICGSPMKLQQPCDIAECYVTCTPYYYEPLLALIRGRSYLADA